MEVAGSFQAYLHPESSAAYLNVAMVRSDPGAAAVIRRDVDALRSLFRARGRTFSLEFNGGRWPDLSPALEAAGLVRTAAHPLMACGPSMLRPVAAAGVELRYLAPADSDSDLAAFVTIRGTDGSMQPPARPEHVRELRSALESGRGRHLLACFGGAPAGTGVLHDTRGIGEMVGIVTRESARRHGVAATISSRLTADHFAQGGRLVFLDAEDDRAVAVYRKIGFEMIGEWLFYAEGQD